MRYRVKSLNKTLKKTKAEIKKKSNDNNLVLSPESSCPSEPLSVSICSGTPTLSTKEMLHKIYNTMENKPFSHQIDMKKQWRLGEHAVEIFVKK